MGVLKNGGTYHQPKNYQDPIEQEIKENLERKKEAQKSRQKLNEELRDVAYQDWRLSLNKKEVEEILGPVKDIKGTFLEKTLKGHFIEEIWPKKQLG